MLTLLAGLEGLRKQKTHHLTTLWKIVRTDAVTFYFTAREEPIAFEGHVYQPAGSLAPSATQLQSGLRARNLEAKGIINSDDITEEDLRAGRFRDANVYEYLVDSRFPWAGAFYGMRYLIRDITFDGLVWNAQIQDKTATLRIAVGNLYTRDCRHDLGDALCQVNLAALTESRSVTSIDWQRRVFRASSLSSASDGYYAKGKVTWTTGDNVGIVSEIKDYVAATKQVKLWLPTPFDIAVSDQFSITPGCDKLIDTCKTKFSNFTNFGGFPFIPGTEKAIQSPDAVTG